MLSDAFPYFEAVLSIICVIEALETYLALRQRSRFFEKALPRELEGVVTMETFEKSQAYNRAKADLSLAGTALDLAYALVFLGGRSVLLESRGFELSNVERFSHSFAFVCVVSLFLRC